MTQIETRKASCKYLTLDWIEEHRAIHIDLWYWKLLLLNLLVFVIEVDPWLWILLLVFIIDFSALYCVQIGYFNTKFTVLIYFTIQANFMFLLVRIVESCFSIFWFVHSFLQNEPFSRRCKQSIDSTWLIILLNNLSNTRIIFTRFMANLFDRL